jgi:hypothetical protein
MGDLLEIRNSIVPDSMVGRTSATIFVVLDGYSLLTVSPKKFVTQMLAPSKATPFGWFPAACDL